MRKLTLLIPIYVILYIWCIVSCKSQDHSGPSGPAEEEVETVTCVDKIQNGDETDIDCGGSTCPECKSNQKCVTSTDCVSNICEDDTRQCAEIEVDSEKAVEIALKMSIQYWLNKGKKNKNKFIFFKNGYHGDTSAAMAICDPKEGMHSLFKGYLNKNFLAQIPNNEMNKNNLIQLLEKNKNKIAGIIIEPLVQGAGGMKFHSASTLDFIYKVKKENDIILIYDEIATGFYRTGTMFAFQQSNSVPDILCIGKALTGGFISLAATIASKKIFNAFFSHKKNMEFMHGPTYMANPLACSAANASLDLFQNKNYENIVNEIEKSLKNQLKKFFSFNFVKEVRVKGAIGVIELFILTKKDIVWLRKNFIKNGVWLRPLGNIVYFTPPLLISKKDLKYLTQTTYQIFKTWKK